MSSGISAAAMFADTVIHATSLASRPGIFFLGPFSLRLSFASQQHRALNLASALLSTGKIKPGQALAVVGCGVSGVMMAAALVRTRCTVAVYEAHGDVLARQRNAIHRYVHPSVNFWPATPLNPTTDFPFFDWYADRCADVISLLETEWNAIFRGEMAKLFMKCRVTSLERVEDGIEVCCDNADANAIYDAVIVATGFDEEQGLPGSIAKSYWIPDELDNLRDTGVGEVWVSGLGDGGVIDALRLAHRDFRSGKLVASVAQALMGRGILDQAETAIRKFEASAPPDKTSLKLAKVVEGLAANLPRTVEDMLNSSLRAPGTAFAATERLQVHLVGREPHPYSVKASPIHLLMLAHAIGANVIHYKIGSVVDAGAHLAVRSTGVADSPLAEGRTVVRHGPRAVVSDLLEAAELVELRSRQEMLSDYHTAPVWRELFKAAGTLPNLWKKDKLSVYHRANTRKFEADYPDLYFSIGSSAVTYMDRSEDGSGDRCLPKTYFGLPVSKTKPRIGRPI